MSETNINLQQNKDRKIKTTEHCFLCYIVELNRLDPESKTTFLKTNYVYDCVC